MTDNDEKLNIRYKSESKMLSYLSNRQLNLQKNINKSDFETLSIQEIFNKLEEEMKELKEEFNKKDLNYDNIFSEIGDVGGCLSGLIAWVNKECLNERE